MNRQWAVSWTGLQRFLNVPRERGDEPHMPQLEGPDKVSRMFPASAGMNRDGINDYGERMNVPCSPRARG